MKLFAFSFVVQEIRGAHQVQSIRDLDAVKLLMDITKSFGSWVSLWPPIAFFSSFSYHFPESPYFLDILYQVTYEDILKHQFIFFLSFSPQSNV